MPFFNVLHDGRVFVGGKKKREKEKKCLPQQVRMHPSVTANAQMERWCGAGLGQA